MFELIQPYLDNIITLVLGGFIGWFPNRKREAITNQQTIVDLYQDSLTDLKNRYEEKYQDLKSTFDEKLNSCNSKIDELGKALEDWKKKYFNLKNDFDKYKKEHP
jgi:molecular chaperone GrpE (heat shock protein)